MVKLSVNLNKVALLRNARSIGIPSVTRAATTCLAAGADGITVHPRPDQRHIRTQDVLELADLLRAQGGVEYNIEGNPFPEYLELVRRVRPTQCTLVPDSPEALTSDHGWDLKREGARLRPLIAELRALGMRVSLFMDAEAGIERAAEVGADRVELYTEPYAAAHARGEPAAELERFAAAARAAQAAGLGVNAGHDLNRDNLGAFVAAMPGLLEVSIGHALIADALDLGLQAAVRAYLRALGRLN